MNPDVIRLIHISDVHFGREDRAALEQLAAFTSRLKPDAVVFAGDITQEGRHSEFEAAREWLDNLKFPVIAAPGNHDTPLINMTARVLKPFARYTRYMHGMDGVDRLVELRGGTVRIVAINSARGVQVPVFAVTAGRTSSAAFCFCGILPVRLFHRGNCGCPYLGVQALCGVEGRCVITLGVDDTMDPDPRPEVVPEQLPYGRLVIWREHIQSQACGRNIFGIRHNQVTALVQPIHGARERETRQQPRQRQVRASEDACRLPTPRLPEPYANPQPHLQQEEHPCKQHEAKENHLQNRHLHDTPRAGRRV